MIPYDSTNYNAYLNIRKTLAYRQDALAATVLNPDNAIPSGRQMALAPELGQLKTLFDAGKMGVIMNIGPLVEPTTLAQYKAQSVALPPKLFSHSDQQTFWQASSPEGTTTGWGGRIGDLMLSSNDNALFTSISVSGNVAFLGGDVSNQYSIPPSGPSSLLRGSSSPLFGSAACANALRSLVTQARKNVLESAHAGIMQRSVDGDNRLRTALGGIPPITTPFNTANQLAAQLQMVAKLIAARTSLGVKRQVFFVSLGGFDNHDGLVTAHPGLLKQVAEAMSSFYAATEELGVANQVTSFTASDFGRTLAVNNDGSDHGWGSHHFVVGGAVAGKRLHGTLPAIAVNGPDDVGQGRLLPTTAVDQLAASLASWFGVSATDMRTVLPYSSNFDLTSLKLFANQTHA